MSAKGEGILLREQENLKRQLTDLIKRRDELSASISELQVAHDDLSDDLEAVRKSPGRK